MSKMQIDSINQFIMLVSFLFEIFMMSEKSYSMYEEKIKNTVYIYYKWMCTILGKKK